MEIAKRKGITSLAKRRERIQQWPRIARVARRNRRPWADEPYEHLLIILDTLLGQVETMYRRLPVDGQYRYPYSRRDVGDLRRAIRGKPRARRRPVKVL
jgi:hypothetical protein